MVKKPILISAACISALLLPTAQASCGSAVCSINTNIETQGRLATGETRVGLRFEFIDQDQPRAGRHKVGVGEIRRHDDEVRTINRNYFASVDHSLTPSWDLSIQAPLFSRTHDHIHNHHGDAITEQWSFSELGDVRVLARHHFSGAHAGTHSSGLNLGLKLPTGGIDVENDDGEQAERSLQPGTGSTDALLGFFYNDQLVANKSSWFVSTLWQQPLAERDDYRPGTRLSLDVGLRYAASPQIDLHLQLNTQFRARDRGANAEPEDTGGTFINLSPGVSYAFAPDTEAYLYVQQPLYQRVNGVQLTEDWSAVVGVSRRF